MNLRSSFAAAVAVLGLLAPAARADDLFSITATSSNASATAGSSSVIGLVDKLQNHQEQFTAFNSVPYNASLNYAGINNAFTFQQTFDSAGHKIVEFRVPSVGLDKTFSSADGELNDQIKSYLKKDGLAKLTEFQATVGRESPAGIVDGNPLAATALLADTGYNQFALHNSPLVLDQQSYANGAGVTTRLWTSGGVLDTGGITGNYVDLAVASEIRFNDFIGLTFTTPFRYLHLRSASVYMGGEVVGVPIDILPAKKGNPISWEITPAGHAVIAGSEDFVSGGLVYGAQVNSSLNFSVNGLTLTLADNASWFHGADVSIDGYDFNTRVDQWVLKNGLRATKNFGNFFLDGSATYTNFLHNAYVGGYFTPELGVGFKFGPHDAFGLRLGYAGHFGEHFNSNGGNILLYFSH